MNYFQKINPSFLFQIERYYLLDVREFNYTGVNKNGTLRIDWRTTWQEITYLYFRFNYTIQLSSCNTYGCAYGRLYKMNVNPIEREIELPPFSVSLGSVLIGVSLLLLSLSFVYILVWFYRSRWRVKRVPVVKVINGSHMSQLLVSRSGAKSLMSIPEGSTLV